MEKYWLMPYGENPWEELDFSRTIFWLPFTKQDAALYYYLEKICLVSLAINNEYEEENICIFHLQLSGFLRPPTSECLRLWEVSFALQNIAKITGYYLPEWDSKIDKPECLELRFTPFPNIALGEKAIRGWRFLDSNLPNTGYSSSFNFNRKSSMFSTGSIMTLESKMHWTLNKVKDRVRLRTLMKLSKLFL